MNPLCERCVRVGEGWGEEVGGSDRRYESVLDDANLGHGIYLDVCVVRIAEFQRAVKRGTSLVCLSCIQDLLVTVDAAENQLIHDQTGELVLKLIDGDLRAASGDEWLVSAWVGCQFLPPSN